MLLHRVVLLFLVIPFHFDRLNYCQLYQDSNPFLKPPKPIRTYKKSHGSILIFDKQPQIEDILWQADRGDLKQIYYYTFVLVYEFIHSLLQGHEPAGKNISYSIKQN